MLRHYEGLIFRTAERVKAAGVEHDFEDIAQRLRIKAWRALLSFDPARATERVGRCRQRNGCRCVRCRHIFACVFKESLSILRLKRHGDLFIEDIAPPSSDLSDSHSRSSSRDRFDFRHGSVQHDDVYADVEREPLRLPNTLTAVEVQVVTLLFFDFRQQEVVEILGLEKREMERMMKAIRLKLADWRPARTLDVPGELLELPKPQRSAEDPAAGRAAA